MNRNDVRLLQAMRSYPSLTITLPTHRTSPDNRQDPIRVKNLVTEAGNRLMKEFSRREAEPILTRLDALTKEIDYRTTLDGLALFVSSEAAQAFVLPFTLNERVVIDETFFTRDLVFAMNRTPRYWVLALSEQPTRLYEGVRENLQEVNSSFFPASHSGPGGERALPNDPAVNSSAYRDEYHRQFFRSIDTAFSELNAVDPLPLALVGVDRYLSFYREVAGSANTVITTLTGNHDKTPAHELGALVWPLVKQSLAAQRERVFGELEAAIGAQRAASTLGEVWRFAHEGRVALLVVEEDYHQAATIDPSGMILTPVADPTTPGVLDDAVDEVITAVLDRGGRVVFADPAALAQHQRIAAVLRY